ncbi:MAG: 1-acyl-sn-glycerol-3-phosphate acyltransferase [Gammaproteobacteria bacterium]|nr:1-acyl-sn-glycerol-3-phosphate acyltransferase [Gammaproteobacteria bacterium]
MGWFRFFIRLPLVLFYILVGFLIIILLHLLAGKSWFKTRLGKNVISVWMQILSFMIGLRIYVEGKPVTGLLVANHISWLDIIALGSITGSRFVSKDDVLYWPVIGLLPKWSGTFFLKRGSAAAVSRLNVEIQSALRDGSTVAIFPEGRTMDGREVHPFFSALFQAGIDAGVPVQPVAIRYIRNEKRDQIASFSGDITFLVHVLSVLKAPSVNVFFHFCEPILERDITRKELAKKCQNSVTKVFESEPQYHE